MHLGVNPLIVVGLLGSLDHGLCLGVSLGLLVSSSQSIGILLGDLHVGNLAGSENGSDLLSPLPRLVSTARG